jgi:hypothetical protein
MAIERVIDEEVLGRHQLAFDGHAIRRMAERGVTEDQVIQTLNGPDITGLPADPGRLRVRKKFSSRESVDVIYEEDPTQIVVISVTKNVKK